MWIARGSRLGHLGLSGRKLDGWPEPDVKAVALALHFSGNFVLFFRFFPGSDAFSRKLLTDLRAQPRPSPFTYQ